jgi:RNA polymerase sigma factor (TIGR02999 family)
MEPSADVTRLLQDFRSGKQAALDSLMPVVYAELRRIAAGYLAGQRGHTLQPTALIHEAYLRLAGRNVPEWQDRAHFFAVSATIMRQILVDHAREKLTAKRGEGAVRVELDERLTPSDERPDALVALDDALRTLAGFDERRAKVLELRFFGGLSVEETAEALGISVATVGREARLAEAWLLRELNQNR